MSYTSTEQGSRSQHLCLPAEITPLQRMNSGDGRDGQPHQTKQQHKHRMGHPDLYPGFDKLLPQHPMSSNPQGFEAIRTEPSKDYCDDSNINSNKKKRRPQEQEDDEEVTGKDDSDDAKRPANEQPAGRKRRRSDSTSQTNAAASQDHQHQHQHQKSHREKSYVHHEYHDYSGLSGGPVALPPLPKKGRGGVSSMFPTVLHHMLDDAEKLGFAHIISWMHHGRAFHVHKPDRFVAEVMTKYFRHTRLSSFQRQLSLYGFTRLARKGPDRGAYYHECFLRGMMHLCSNIQRTRVKGTMVRQSSSPESEPDFSALPPVGVNHNRSSSMVATAAPFSGGGGSSVTMYSSGAAAMTNLNVGNQTGGEGDNEPMFANSNSNNTAEEGGLTSNINTNPPSYAGMPQLMAATPTTATPPPPPMTNPPGLSLGLQTIDDQHLTTPAEGLHHHHHHHQPPQQPPQGGATLDSIQPADRPRGTKFMRHLLARGGTGTDTSTTCKPTAEEDGSDQSVGTLSNLLRQPHANSPEGGDESHCSADSKTQSSSDSHSKTRKVDADLAVFLEEVDLESDEDECLESEEAMARILEQDVSQISEV